MSPKVFTPQSPGKLVPTQASEEFVSKGQTRTREAKGIAFVPNPLPPPIERARLIDPLYDLLAESERALGMIEGLTSDLEIARLLWSPLIQREAILSSRIENTIATAKEVALYEAGQQPLHQDTIEVANYRRALEHGLESELPLCLRLIKDMHGILLRNVRGENKRPGQIRSVQNWIGSDPSAFAKARFVPPPPGETLDTCLRDLEAFLNSSKHRIPELLAIAMAHYQFEAIHPFADGNGRLGRVLIALSLCKRGSLTKPLVYVSGYFEKNDQRYRDLLLRVSTDGDWESWCRFFLEAVVDQSRDAIERLRRIREIRERIRATLAAENAPGRVFALVDHLIQDPAVTASETARLLEVTAPTARDYIERLVSAGFLQESTGRSYGQVWAAIPVLDIIESSDDARQAQH